jgi:hypothetical protein
MSKKIQIRSLIPQRLCVLSADLKKISKLQQSVVDCNGLTGNTVSLEQYEETLRQLAELGWQRVSGERGTPEGIGTVYLDNPTIQHTKPYQSPEMVAYLNNR